MQTVNDLMTVAPRTVTPEFPLREAARIMVEENCRHLPVVDGDTGKLVGILTDRDIRSARHTPYFDVASVESCMTRDPLTVSPDTDAKAAAELLALYKYGSLPVLADGQVVGIVTVTDFLTHYGQGVGDGDKNPKSVFWEQFSQSE